MKESIRQEVRGLPDSLENKSCFIFLESNALEEMAGNMACSTGFGVVFLLFFFFFPPVLKLFSLLKLHIPSKWYSYFVLLFFLDVVILYYGSSIINDRILLLLVIIILSK